jgi:hypothetical protein
MSIRTASLALATAMTLAAPTVALANTQPVAAHVEKSSTAPAPAPQQDAATYADREAADKKVANYEGGQVVVYFSGAALVALILLLILI